MFLCEFLALFNENFKSTNLPNVSKKCSKRDVGCSASSDYDRLFGLWNNMKIIEYEIWWCFFITKFSKAEYLWPSVSLEIIFFLNSFYSLIQMLQANVFLTKPVSGFGHLLQLIIKSNLQSHSWEKCCASCALKIQHGLRDGCVAVM